MLKRQKTILAILANAKRPLRQTLLVKLAFLLRRETILSEDSTFYEFVPYKFGPFSFALYRELDVLRRFGYLSPPGEYLALRPGMADEADAMANELPPATRSAVVTILRRYGPRPHDALLRDVYARYPWFAVNSERADLRSGAVKRRPVAPIAVYTVGYERKTIDGFLDGLLRDGIQMIADVRANPISRKYGFAKKSLRGIAGNLRIGYEHFPDLGVLGEKRRNLRGLRSYQRLLDVYEKETLVQQAPEVSRLGVLIRSAPTALLCVEQDVRCCHRSRLASAVSRATGLRVVHLS